MKEIVSIITIPVAAGLLLFFVPEKLRTFKGIFALLVSIVTGYLSVLIYSHNFQAGTFDEILSGSSLNLFGINLRNDVEKYAVFNADNLSRLIILFTSLFSILILLYSLVYIKEGKARNYYPYFLITIGCSYGAVLSDNLLLFITFWGILGITLYKLIPGNSEESSATAKKTLILIGASDSIMLIGIALIWRLTGSLNISRYIIAHR